MPAEKLRDRQVQSSIIEVQACQAYSRSAI